MNAKVAVIITATGDTRKRLSGSDGRFVFNPLLALWCKRGHIRR